MEVCVLFTFLLRTIQYVLLLRLIHGIAKQDGGILEYIKTVLLSGDETMVPSVIIKVFLIIGIICHSAPMNLHIQLPILISEC